MLNHPWQKSLTTLSLAGLLALTSLSAAALESDREQAIRIQADAAMVDENAGTSIYRGNVIIQQGTLKVTQEVEIFSSDSEIVQIIAKADQKSSRLAHYQQQLNANNDRVSAEQNHLPCPGREVAPCGRRQTAANQ